MGSLHFLGGLALAGWIGLAFASHYVDRPLWICLGVLALEWAVFLAAWRLLAGPVVKARDSKRLVVPIQLWAVLFLVCGLFATPLMEDDYFRFLWDGRQFATTGNPYTPTPAGSFGDSTLPDRFEQILDQINYPHVPTIYGPVCQSGFLLSYWMAPGQLWPWKLLLFFAVMALIQVSIRLAGNQPVGARVAVESPGSSGAIAGLLVGWCPLLVFETGFNAHPDLLGIAFMAAAMLVTRQNRDSLCGVLCGLAVGAKLFALLVVPFLCRRSRRAWLGFAAMVLVMYAPFWMQGTGADFAGLKAFAQEWEFNSSVYAVARWSFGMPMAKALCGFAFIAVWLLLLLRWYRRAPGDGVPPGAAIYGALFLTAATVNPWYLLWLLPFLTLRTWRAGIVAMALVSLSYITGLNAGISPLGNFEHPNWVRPIEYGGIALAGVIELWRWWKARRTNLSLTRERNGEPVKALQPRIDTNSHE